jgi:hypothetical protein
MCIGFYLKFSNFEFPPAVGVLYNFLSLNSHRYYEFVLALAFMISVKKAYCGSQPLLIGCLPAVPSPKPLKH